MMRKSGRPLKPEEYELWRRYVRHVVPIRQDMMDELDAAPRPHPHPHPKAQPHSYIPPVHPKRPPPDQTRMDQNRVDGATQRRLRRGRARIDARLDLHGMRQAEAHDALIGFVLRAKDRGHRCVLIITGKGTRGAGHTNPYEASGPGVLRTRLRQWLAQDPLRAICYGLEEAHPRHGGAGAFYVFIRRKG